MDIAQWLHDLGLDQYAQAFQENDVDEQTLRWLTLKDLADIGVKSVGHRRKLEAAIQQLGEAPSPPAADEPQPPPQLPLQGERRQLSVLRADMVGSTALSERLHPEDLHELLRAFHDGLSAIVREFDGHVANSIGHFVLAYFGWPQAHEDDAERAARAALAMAQAAARLQTPAGDALAVCVGVATGSVVVGDLLREGPAQGQSAIGAALGLSAQLQTLAAPGQVVVDELTRRLLPASFAVHSMGQHALQGIAQPVAAYAVSGEQPADSRFDARQGRHLPPMFGRDQELALLRERWTQAQDGDGQAVLLVGEAGIGKSRLVRALLDACAAEPHELIRWQCSPYHTGSALWPVIQRLERSAGLLEQDSTDTALDKLEALLGPDSDAVALCAALLGLDGSHRYGPLELSPQELRQRTLELLLEQVLQRAGQRTLLMVVEDAHWIDPTTLELLERCLESVDGTRMLLLMTSRPDQQPKLDAHPSMTQLSLSRLSRASADAIVAQLGGATLQMHTRAAIVAQSDGVPLFVEELTKAVQETGEAAAIPASLHGSLMARLDRIPAAKEVAQIAACIGREFDEALVRSVAERSDSVGPALEDLARAELVFRKGGEAHPRFTFKHALVQEAAYDSLLRSKRRKLHGRILETLEARRPDTPPELLAHHAASADLTDKAIAYWRRAGDAAMAKSAYVESAGYFDRALRQIDSLNHGGARRRLELGLQLGLAYAHMGAHGNGAEVTGAAFHRAEQLLEDDPLASLQVHFGLFVSDAMNGRLGGARHRALQLRADAAAIGRDEETMLADWLMGLSHLFTGELDEARHVLERAVALHDTTKPWQPATTYTRDPRVGARCQLGWTLVIQGFADQGKDMLARARSIEFDHPPFGWKLLLHSSCAMSAAFARDVAAVRADATILAELASKQGRADTASFAAKLFAWAAMESGRPPEEVVAAYEAVGAGFADGISFIQSLFFLASQARALAAACRHEEALGAIEQAIHESDRMGQGLFDAELWRVRGEVRLASRRQAPAQALECFERALSIARRRGAKLWELRAATSLARWWVDQGEHDKARKLLAPVHGWFTEGFDMPDMVEARTLLELAQAPTG